MDQDAIGAALDRVSGSYFLKSQQEIIQEKKAAFLERLVEKLGEDDMVILSSIMEELEQRALVAEQKKTELPTNIQEMMEQIEDQKKTIQELRAENKRISTELKHR